MGKNSENLHIVYDNVELTVGALGAGAAIAVASRIDTSRLNGFRIMKTEYWMDYTGKATGEGPLMVGMSPNHSASEIEGAIEADPQASTETVANATAKRPVFPLEMITENETSTVDNESFGTKGVVNPRWSVIEGKALFWFAYNMDTGAGLTTGTIIKIFAKHYGVWLRD